MRQRISLNEYHWKIVVPKLTNFWRKCILLEVLGRWYTRCYNEEPTVTDAVCYCRAATSEPTISCGNPKCQIGHFHPSSLGINNIPKLWYCPNCRTNREFKKARGKKITTQGDALNWILFVCANRKQTQLTSLQSALTLVANLAIFSFGMHQPKMHAK